jgi:hypothetical protein
MLQATGGVGCAGGTAGDAVSLSGPTGTSLPPVLVGGVKPPGPPDVPSDAADVALSVPPAQRPRDSPVAFTLEPYRGLGCWVDVFDWSTRYSTDGRPPAVTTHDLAGLAARGVSTLYVQTARYDRPHRDDDLLERGRLWALTDAAHALGMAVVGWYLPTHTAEDEERDLRRCLAVLADRSFDGLALDIESRAERDVVVRNRRLAELATRLRQAAGPARLGAIVVPPTTMQDVNPQYWPGFDWALLAATFDVFLPMNYWTNRSSDSPWRDAAASTAENIRRLRRHAGREDFPVHVVGGIASVSSAPEVAAMVAAVAAEGATGASLYDLATTGEHLWPALDGLRLR